MRYMLGFGLALVAGVLGCSESVCARGCPDGLIVQLEPGIPSTYDVDLVLDGSDGAFACVGSDSSGWQGPMELVGAGEEVIQCSATEIKIEGAPESVRISVSARDGSWSGSAEESPEYMRVPQCPGSSALCPPYAVITVERSGGSGGGGTGGAGGSGGSVGSSIWAVVSTKEYSALPGGCGERFIDYQCDAVLSTLECLDDEHIDYDEAVICPVCASNGPSDPSSCEGWQLRYGDFLAHLVNASCANWCADDDDCFGHEIRNACGTFAWSLTGAIDEEPIEFARRFAEQNCDACTPVPYATYMRRPGTTVVVPADGEATPDGDSGLLRSHRPACRANQCVLLEEDLGAGGMGGTGGSGASDLGSRDMGFKRLK